MLCDLIADRSNIIHRTGWYEDLAIRIEASTKFVMSPGFTVAADLLSEHKSDLHKLVKFCLLPFRSCWFECSQSNRDSFLRGKAPNLVTDGKPSKIGFL